MRFGCMNSKLFVSLLALGGSVLPTLALAQATYKPLVGIPGIMDAGLNFGDYINALYALSISIAALLAVVKIVIAGMKYMLSDISVTSKSEAIGDIQGAVFGLIVVISAVLILTVINPQLTKTELVIDTATPPAPGVPGVAVAVPATVGVGYTSIPAGSNPAFKTTCLATAGSVHKAVLGNLEVCYAPLPAATASQIDTMYAGQNTSAIKTRYQTAHYPRLISDGGKLASIKTEEGATDVLVAVSLSGKGDWLDMANQSSSLGLNVTCADLRRASGKNVVFESGGAPGASYLACVVKP
jgi:hypothetical protein